jgi:hypothetical protein
MEQILEELQAVRHAVEEIARQRPPVDPGDHDREDADADASWRPPKDLKERWKRHETLVWEIERQSDVGAINLDELLRRYHEKYDRPALMLAQDLQVRALVYQNVVEALKAAKDINATARDLKARYEELGLIKENDNQWPNPLGDWLLRRSLDKLSQFRHAMLELLRTRSRQLLRELNFDPTLAVAFQLSLGTNMSFGISVQPEVTVTRAAGQQP